MQRAYVAARASAHRPRHLEFQDRLPAIRAGQQKVPVPLARQQPDAGRAAIKWRAAKSATCASGQTAGGGVPAGFAPQQNGSSPDADSISSAKRASVIIALRFSLLYFIRLKKVKLYRRRTDDMRKPRRCPRRGCQFFGKCRSGRPLQAGAPAGVENALEQHRGTGSVRPDPAVRPRWSCPCSRARAPAISAATTAAPLEIPAAGCPRHGPAAAPSQAPRHCRPARSGPPATCPAPSARTPRRCPGSCAGPGATTSPARVWLRTGLAAGSTATEGHVQAPALKIAADAGNGCPPVPTPDTKISSWPPVSSNISGPVVRSWIAGLAGFSNCCKAHSARVRGDDFLGLRDGALHALSPRSTPVSRHRPAAACAARCSWCRAWSG